jgi:FlaA1/EpsC-like NDP-sugar epimerase
MEQSGCEAIKNNVLGTYNTANMAEKYGAEKFILISTDKAVNPTNIMGASKRLCEMVIQCRYDSKTNFAAVRFGNVLGSNGSVIPLFKRQIMEGGPVTITDKRIIRYFMTIPDASQLVIQAGAKAEKGELFVLDMGQPVRIYDLAVNMIKLMGFVPGEDIEIKEIGLRPGEKLYEELLMKSEDLEKTDNDLIYKGKAAEMDREELFGILQMLREAADSDGDEIRALLKQAVPEYRY